MAAFDVPNMIPPWLIPTETPGEALAKGIAAGSQIAHNLLASRQLAQQASEFQSKLTLEMQQQDLRTQENRVNMEGRGLGNQLLALKLKDAGEADQQAANWLASYMNRVPTGQEEGTPDPQTLPPLPTNLTARAKVLPVLQMDSAKELAGLAATWTAKKGGWQNPESQAEYLDFLASKPWMAGTPEARKVESYFDVAGKAGAATALVTQRATEATALQTQRDAAALERAKLTGAGRGGSKTAAEKDAETWAGLQNVIRNPDATKEEKQTAKDKITLYEAKLKLGEKVLKFEQAPNGDTVMIYGNGQPKVMKDDLPYPVKLQFQTLQREIVAAAQSQSKAGMTPAQLAQGKATMTTKQAEFDDLAKKWAKPGSPKEAASTKPNPREKTIPQAPATGERQKNMWYQTPAGPMKWMGDGWEAR